MKILIDTVWCWYRDRKTDQWNRIEKLEPCHMYAETSFMMEIALEIYRGRITFSRNTSYTIDYPRGKIK